MGDDKRARNVGGLIIEYDSALSHLADLKCRAKGLVDHLIPICSLLTEESKGEFGPLGFKVTLGKQQGNTYEYPPKEEVEDLFVEITETEKRVKELGLRVDSLRLGVRVLPPTNEEPPSGFEPA